MLRIRDGALMVEVPADLRFGRAVRAVFPKGDWSQQQHVLGAVEVFRFTPALYSIVERLVVHIWGEDILDLVDPVPDPSEEEPLYFRRFEGWLEAQTARSQQRRPFAGLEDFLFVTQRADTPWAVLHLREGAPQVVIHAAWRALCGLYQVPGGKEPNEEKWKEVNVAYAALKRV